MSMNMNQLKNEMANANVDWAKIREVLSGIAAALEAVAAMIPVGLIRNLLLGLAASINLIISMLPSTGIYK